MSGPADRAREMLPLTPDEDGCTDATGVHWESPARALSGGVLDLCGCSYSEDVAADLAASMIYVAEQTRQVEALTPKATSLAEYDALPKNPVAQPGNELYVDLLLMLLDTADLTDHGGSVGGSFPTVTGWAWAETLSAATPKADG